MAEQDVKDTSAGVLKDLKRFQLEKEDDLRRYMVASDCVSVPASANAFLQIAYAKCHVDWAKKNVETWREAKEEVEKIDLR